MASEKADTIAEMVAKGKTAGAGGQAHNPTIATKLDDLSWLDGLVAAGKLSEAQAETIRREHPTGVPEYVPPTPEELARQALIDAAALTISTTAAAKDASDALDRAKDKKTKALAHVAEVDEQIAYHQAALEDALDAEENAAAALNALNTPEG